MKLYNLTLHKQEQLANLVLTSDIAEVHDITEVEVAPRLKPVEDPSDYDQLKAVVVEAVKDIPPGAFVLIGGLGQYQALITQLPFKFYFADFDPVKRQVKGVIEHLPFTRYELFDIENS